MKCPHCLDSFHDDLNYCDLGAFYRNQSSDYDHSKAAADPMYPKDMQGEWSVFWQKCPACKRIIIILECQKGVSKTSLYVHPKGVARTPASPLVPANIANDYREACLVLNDSPKASAALSRRCLQTLLRECGKVKFGNLENEIEQVLPSLPSNLSSLIHAVRVVGNYAAHPTKSTHTGEIIDVEPGEAEMLLDVLDMAFDHFFVKPAETQRIRDEINAKLVASGRSPMK